MREDFRPKLQVRRCFEDRNLRRLHRNGVDFMHADEWPASDGNPLGQRCCATSAEHRDTPSRSISMEEKNHCPATHRRTDCRLARQNWVLRLEEQGIEPLPLGRTRTPSLHVRPSMILVFND